MSKVLIINHLIKLNYLKIDENGSDEDLDYNEMQSHKIEKNTASQKDKKRLIVILEHS
jgi:hypothetical protein